MGIARIVKSILRATRGKNIEPIIHPVTERKILEGKVAFIAGGNGGLGFAISKSLVESGCDVIIGGSNSEKIEKCVDNLQANTSQKIRGIRYDISDINNIEKQFNEAINIFGKIDIFIDSAGVHTENVDMWNMSPEEFERVMKINIEGAYFSVLSAAKYMKNSKIQGHILLISSSRGLEPAWSPYGISKWGMNGMVKGFAQQLVSYGINVNAVAPGSTATALLNYHEGQSIDTDENKVGRYIMPDEVASLVKLIVSDCGNMITGEVIAISGGRGTFDIR